MEFSPHSCPPAQPAYEERCAALDDSCKDTAAAADLMLEYAELLNSLGESLVELRHLGTPRDSNCGCFYPVAWPLPGARLRLRLLLTLARPWAAAGPASIAFEQARRVCMFLEQTLTQTSAHRHTGT